MFHKTFLAFILLPLSFAVSADLFKPYGESHQTTCFDFGGVQVKCGEFRLFSTVLSKKYTLGSPGKDVLDSFSLETHPGDHPFLARLSKAIGFTDVDPDSDFNRSFAEWGVLSLQEKSKLLDFYTASLSVEGNKKLMKDYFERCFNYWLSPDAVHSESLALPTFSEMAAFCAATSGILDRGNSR